MKSIKIALLLISLITTTAKSQSFVLGYNNLPNINSYWNETHSSAVTLNNKFYNSFTAWQSGFSSFNITKTDINGAVIVWRKEDSLVNKGAPSKLIASANTLYYICKNQLTALDTNLNIKYIRTFTLSTPNSFWYFNDCLIASNGDVVIAGASADYNGSIYTNIKALVVRVNATTGAVIYSKTFTNATQNIATSIVENTANNSLFISGRVINNGYTTFLLNISNDNLGTLISSKYFTPNTSNVSNFQIKKMMIIGSNLYLFGHDSAAKLMVTKTNLNLTSIVKTNYYTNFIYQDAVKYTGNGGFYLSGYGARTYTSVPLSNLQIDTSLNVTKSIIYPNIINYYDSTTKFSLDYNNGLTGAYSNYGASIFEKNGYIFNIATKNTLSNTNGNGTYKHNFVKEATTYTSSCFNSFNLITSNYGYDILQTPFTTNTVSATSFSQTSFFANITPTTAITCGTVTAINTNQIQNAPIIYASGKTIYLKNLTVNNSVFEIYSLNGQKITSLQLNSNQTQIDVSTIANGIYLYKMYYNGQVYSKKIVLE